MEYNNPNENWRKRQDYYDRRESESGEVIKQIVKTLLVCLAFALLGWLLTGCTTTKYVPVIETHTDTLIHTVHHRDSIHVTDSTVIREKGDTVFVDRWHTRWHDRTLHDTIYQARQDSIPVPYKVTEYVERRRSPMEWGLILIGVAALLGGIVWIAARLKKFLPF